MKDYLVFGGCFRSEVEFPDLSPAVGSQAPDWELRLETSDPPEPVALQGTRWIEPEWVFRLYSVKGGLRLDYGGVGSFGIFSAGREIVWYPGSEPESPEIRLEMARAIVLGPVMALVLRQAGILCLHGSAVTLNGQGAAFLAPKFHGKSTLALALTAAGGRLLTDDLVAIDPGPQPVVFPGVHSVRVMHDIAERLIPRFPQATATHGFKTTLTEFPSSDLAWEPAPLTAIYFIEPLGGMEDGRAVSREPLTPTRAAAALAQGKKLADSLIGSTDAGAMLESIVSVSLRVPVYRMPIMRDLERLSEAVDEIMAWHGMTAEPRAD